MGRPRKYTNNADKQAAYRARKRNSTPSKPLLRYFGGKWQLAPWIIQYFPAHTIYCEPYGGAASVLMQKARSFSEIFNDLDGEVVNLFRVLRDRSTAKDLRRRLKYTPFAREEFEAAYEPIEESIERARRLIVRAWMGHSSTGAHRATGFRTNVVNTRRSTPAGDWRKWLAHMDRFTDRLQGVCIEHRPAIDVMVGHDAPTTLFYVDTPYPLSTRPGSGEVYRHEMTDSDHRALATYLRTVRGMVVMSGYACDLYDVELYPDWRRVERPHMADGGKARVEVLWLNAAAGNALDPSTMPLFADATVRVGVRGNASGGVG